MHTIVELGLLQEDGGRIFCFKLLKRLDTSMTSNPRFREMIAGAKVVKSPQGLEYKSNHDTIMTESCYHHESHHEGPHASLQDEKRKEKKRGEEPPLFNFETFAKECAETWNRLGIKPAFRFTTSAGLTGKEREGFIAASSRYSFEEIEQAMKNYREVGASKDHELFPKGYGLAGFLASGVEKFTDDSDPWTRCKIRERKSPERQSSVEVPGSDATREFIKSLHEDEPEDGERVAFRAEDFLRGLREKSGA